MKNKTYLKLLSVEYTKINLMTAAIYLAAYELLKSSIIDDVKGFWVSVEATGESKMLEAYRNEVLMLDQSVFVASCKWLQSMEALSDKDIKDLLDIRNHRHQIAHELPELLVDDEVNINIKYLFNIQKLLNKIDTWRIKEEELYTNPEFIGLDIDKIDVKSGKMMVLNHLISILTSSEEIDNKTE